MIIKTKKGICYSGYRLNQAPWGAKPSYEEIKEDLDILIKDGYEYIRMYSPNEHARMTLETIKKYNLPLKVFLGFEPLAEINNPNCPWDHRQRSNDELELNKASNDLTLSLLVSYSKVFSNEIVVLSIGNENTASWHANRISEERLIHFAKRLKKESDKLVTFNEGTIEWRSLTDLANEVDLLSIHYYPLWHGISLEESINKTIDEYNIIKSLYPNKQIIFGETGWTTECDNQMNKEIVNEENQKLFIDKISEWGKENNVIIMLFEAFDEPWKGSSNPSEPEKHWGLYYENRKPKLIARK